MSKTFRFGLVALPLLICSFSASTMMAQGTVPPPDPAQQPAAAPQTPTQPASPSPGERPTVPEGGAGIPPTMTVAPAQPPPPKEPYVLEDGGFYVLPFYWLTNGAPRLRGGFTAPNILDLQLEGKPRPGMGVEIGVPAGRSNTFRVTAFKVQGHSGITTAKDAYIFGEVYTAGTFLNNNYKFEVVKASWDYLSYTWRKPHTNIHLKTLYEAQYVNANFSSAAPFLDGTLDPVGNSYLVSGSKSIVLPTLGMAVGSEFGKIFRWDVRGSGFGIPGHGAIGDLEATVAVRVSKVEVLVGERAYYVKTSPRSDLYTNIFMQGVYGGLRFVWEGVNKK
jgi:hypothetical protein